MARNPLAVSGMLLLVSALGISLTATAYGQAVASPAFEKLHSDLQLSASQEEGWRAFERAYAVDPQEFARRRAAGGRMSGLSGPQRVDQAIDLMKADLTALQRRGDALKAFYATLSAEQQRIFDRDTLSPGPGFNRSE